MQTYKDLFIDVGESGIVDYIDRVSKCIKKPWSRSQENEENSKYLGDAAYCFERIEDSHLPNAGLSIFHKENNIWYVPNVVPLESGQLSYDQYNNLLTEFHDNHLNPASEGSDVKVTITSGNINDEDILGASASKLLKTFSATANKSTGSNHPSDRKRWLAFIVESCRTKAELDTGNLERLLQEQGWSEEASIELIIEFEFAKDLIDFMGE